MFYRIEHIVAFLLLALGLLTSADSVEAQYMTRPNFEKLLPTGNTYKMGWWELEGGGVYNFPTSGEQSKVLIDKQDTSYQASFDPSAGFAYSLRLGRYLVTPELRFFKYIDYSIGYRRVVGHENYKATMSAPAPNGGAQTAEWSGNGSFNESFLMANLHLNNVLQVSDHGFIQNTIGVNGEYRIQSGRIGYDGNAYKLDPEQPPTFMGQIHYRLGYGRRISEQFFIVPSLQTSILNLYPFDGASTLPLLNSRYRTVSLNIKLMFLKRHRPSGY